MVGSQLFLVFLDVNSHTQFTIGVLVFAFVSGPMFPSGMSWMDRYLRMNNMAYALISAGNSVGGFFFSWLAGQLFEKRSGSMLAIFYLSLASCLLAFVVTIVMQVLASRRGDRFDVGEHLDTTDEPPDDSDVTNDTSRLVRRSLSSVT